MFLRGILPLAAETEGCVWPVVMDTTVGMFGHRQHLLWWIGLLWHGLDKDAGKGEIEETCELKGNGGVFIICYYTIN